jgi:hypothetical protein
VGPQTAVAVFGPTVLPLSGTSAPVVIITINMDPTKTHTIATADPIGQQLRTAQLPTRDGIWAEISRVARKVADFLSGRDFTKNPIHADFVIVEDGWYWNRVRRPSHEPDYKVQIFFNSSDLHLLDGCSFHCKFGDNLDDGRKFQYCGFAYPRSTKEMESLERWASRFPDASVFTYGDWDARGRWQPGTFVKGLSGDNAR